MPSEILISAILILAKTSFGFPGRTKCEKFLKLVFRGKLGPQEILQKSCSDGQGHKFQKFLKCFCVVGSWALLKSFKTSCPMVRVINFRSYSSCFLCEL